MAFHIGISSCITCMNIDCLKPLSDFELKKQTEYSIRYYFCIKCRGKGIPKYKFVTVKCVSCNNSLRIASMCSSFVCRDCAAKRVRSKELGKSNFDAKYKKVLKKASKVKRRYQYRVMDTIN